MLSANTIEELRTILREEYHLDTTPAEASDIASSLVQFAETLIEIENNKGYD